MERSDIVSAEFDFFSIYRRTTETGDSNIGTKTGSMLCEALQKKCADRRGHVQSFASESADGMITVKVEFRQWCCVTFANLESPK